MVGSMTHILVVDDDTRLRGLIRDFLTRNGFNVTMAKHAEDARNKLSILEFDIVVLDVMMPGESGLGLAKFLRAKSAIPILLLTARGETKDRIEGLESGADDYLTKPFEPRELILRIESILRRTGEENQTKPKLIINGYVFTPNRSILKSSDELIRLTRNEVSLLNIFAKNAGATISRSSLATKVGATSNRAVDVQITRLRRKIEPDPRNPQYLQTVWGEGYVLWPD